MEINSESILSYLRSKKDDVGACCQDPLHVNLFESGIIDSVGMVELVLFLEKQFEIRFDTEDLDPAKFQTITDMLELVQQCKSRS
jgi:D-alanine--poly(phosphoribitol) ligase subunit 2